MRQTDKEYAEALFDLALEEGVLSECLADAQAVRDIFRELPEYTELLSSPAIPVSERLSVIDEAFSERVHRYIVYFLKLLCEKGRIRLLFEIFEEFEKLCLAHSGRCTAYVSSAVELTDGQKTALLEKLEATHKKKIDPVYTVDPQLMGGLKIELCGKVYDGTLKRRIRDVKDVMLDEQTR